MAEATGRKRPAKCLSGKIDLGLERLPFRQIKYECLLPITLLKGVQI